MFLVVTGGSGSGKSAYAEERVTQFADPVRYYIATMQCFDEESRERVRRHRSLRAGKGFTTVERQLALKDLVLTDLRVDVDGESGLTEGQTAGMHKGYGESGVSVLLECMSNLAANEMFDPAGAGVNSCREIELGIDRLVDQCDNLVVVTNEIFSDGISYDDETVRYQKLLGEINRYMVDRADEVVEVVCGIPIWIKERKEPKGAV